jgi:hypothetical protein
MKEELARRAVACKHWRWMPGMNVLYDSSRYIRIQNADYKGIVIAMEQSQTPRLEPLKPMLVDELLNHQWTEPVFDQSCLGIWEYRRANTLIPGIMFLCVPDLGDAATLGCLLALVRTAWANDTLHLRPESDRWCVWSEEPGAFVFDTEAEALVAALEAAP